ncbi:sensor histidine kinase [Parafrankia discariae]|uniref:sensor histidine kinase n=1 Tax=Parafrankia discariae TaxID=365528 RepID=UPI00036A27A0|nr:ATP-binding protein [Parafrankia discariae]
MARRPDSAGRGSADRGGAPPAGPRGVAAAATGPHALPAHLVRQVIAGLPSGLVVVNAEDVVVLVNSTARRMGVVDGDQLSVGEVADLVKACRFAAAERNRQLDLPPVPEPPLTRARPDQTALAVWAYARPLGDSGYVSVLLDDITDSRRVEAVRRDFVANVSHELKTPVGALHVLAEAVSEASEDPVAVRRFASRMTHESTRLARLVQEIIDLSRLQGAEPMPDLAPVPVSVVLAEAVDRNRFSAQAQEISVAVIGAGGLRVRGDENQLVTAVANLLDNAISYSPRGTRVVLGVRQVGATIEISVADEGIGIAEKDLERVFERFYRADPARSRATGGTGLGLAIVKHIATNHGGSVSVWSAEGRGSTFTLRLPSGADRPRKTGVVPVRPPVEAPDLDDSASRGPVLTETVHESSGPTRSVAAPVASENSSGTGHGGPGT